MAKKKNKTASAGENNHHHNDAVPPPEKPKNMTVVLKTDLHCEGCANKVVKCIRSFEGVEGVKCEWDSNKVNVLGKVDPLKLREKMEQKTHKKVELISPLPKKEKKENSNGKDKKNEGKEKKTKQPPVTTAVMKVHLHCEGCVNKIYKIVSKAPGYQEMKVDKQKDMITVTGALDMKELAENVKKHMRKNVEIVPPKKDGENEKGEKKGRGSNGEGDKAGEGNKMQMQQVQYQYGFPYPAPYLYAPGYYGGSGGDHQLQVQNPYGAYHAPQMFSDENPHACAVM